MTEVPLASASDTARCCTPTAAAALARQWRMAKSDYDTLYDFTTCASPMAALAAELERSTATRAYFPRPNTADPKLRSIFESIDETVARVSRVIDAGKRAHADNAARLRARLLARRRAAFRTDFAVGRRFYAAAGRCLLCDRATRVTSFDCCRTAENEPTVCRQCLERSAFASSEYGTKPEARCPFCAATYAVYRERPAKRKRGE